MPEISLDFQMDSQKEKGLKLITLYIISEKFWWCEKFKIVKFLAKGDSEEEETKITIRMYDTVREWYERLLDGSAEFEKKYGNRLSVEYYNLCREFVKSEGTIPTKKELKKMKAIEWKIELQSPPKDASRYKFLKRDEFKHIFTESFGGWNSYWYTIETLVPED